MTIEPFWFFIATAFAFLAGAFFAGWSLISSFGAKDPTQ